VALNKIDAIAKSALAKKKASLEKASGRKVHLVSGVSGEGIHDVLRAAAREIVKRRKMQNPEAGRPRAWTP
jgi:GTP-binding protein